MLVGMHVYMVHGARSISAEVKQRCGGGETNFAHLDPSGEDSLVVEYGVAHEVEVVVLDARPHSEPGLEAARTGLQQGRLGEGEYVRGQ